MRSEAECRVLIDNILGSHSQFCDCATCLVAEQLEARLRPQVTDAMIRAAAKSLQEWDGELGIDEYDAADVTMFMIKAALDAMGQE